MAYNTDLELRLESAFELFPPQITGAIEQKKMFGGIAFLYRGKMTVGIIKDELVVRVVQEKMKDVLSRKEVRPMDFTKKPMKEFVYVAAEGLTSEEQLQFWIELGLEHAMEKLKQK